MVTGKFPEFIDHINHNKEDNRWENLREVTRTENNRNVPISKNNTTGITGISLHKPTKKYRAYISRGSKQIHLGLFESINDAVQVRQKALIDLGFHSNHGK